MNFLLLFEWSSQVAMPSSVHKYDHVLMTVDGG